MLFLCYPNCTTCKKAEQFLQEYGVSVEKRNIKTANPSKDELAAWHDISGLSLKKFFNTSGQKYKELALKDKINAMSIADQLALLASDGMLVKRPLLVSDDFVLIGFKEKDWQERFSDK